MRHQFFILVIYYLRPKQSALYGIIFTTLVVDVLLGALNCGDTIDKAVSTLFSAVAALYFRLRYPVIILRPYVRPPSVKNKSSFTEVFSMKKMSWKFLYSLWKNDNEGTLVWRSLLKLSNTQVFFIYFFSWNIYFYRAPPMLL